MQDHVPVLSRDQTDRFRKDGFLVIRGLLDPALLDRLIETTGRYWEDARGISAGTKHFDIEPSHNRKNPRLRRISSPTELSDVYVDAAFASVLGDVAADLIGGAVKFYHSKVNFKLSRGGAEISWHQDWPVFPHTNENLLAISVPMNASRRENGCLKVLPGTHKLGPRSHWDGDAFVLNCNKSLTVDELDTAVHVEADPGDLVVHHGLLVHGSDPNTSADLRTTFIVQYAAADAFAYTAPVIDSAHRDRMVRGTPARHARVEAGSIELPPDFAAGYASIYSYQDEDEREAVEH